MLILPVAAFLDLRFVFFDVAGTAGGLSGGGSSAGGSSSGGVAAVTVFFPRRVGLGRVGASPGCDSGSGGEGRVATSGSSSGGFSKSSWRVERVAASPALYSA